MEEFGKTAQKPQIKKIDYTDISLEMIKNNRLQQVAKTTAKNKTANIIADARYH
jgi:hypothetical protein